MFNPQDYPPALFNLREMILALPQHYQKRLLSAVDQLKCDIQQQNWKFTDWATSVKLFMKILEFDLWATKKERDEYRTEIRRLMGG